MTPELTKKLARIEAACRKVLELDSAMTEQPWSAKGIGVRFPNKWEGYRRIMPAGEGQCIQTQKRNQDRRQADATFIAFARSITPDMARALLAQISKNERCIAAPAQPYFVREYAEQCLQSIADSFQETSLP